jgi:PAP2 superfamily
MMSVPIIHPASRLRRLLILAWAGLLPAGCDDASAPSPATAVPAEEVEASVHSSRETVSSVRWIRTALELLRSHLADSPPPNPTRIHAYLSLAQYHAVLAARERRTEWGEGTRPSLAGAAAGASVAVLREFYPLDTAAIDEALAAQRAEYRGRPAQRQAFNRGARIGKKVGADVLALAATDNYGKSPAPPPPVGPGKWVSNGDPIVAGGFGARPFFLESADEINSDPPVAFGSDEFQAALAEVRAIADARTPEQVAIVEKWRPFSGAVWNGIAADLIEKHRRSELQAARIFAYANVAAFDAIIGCFHTKFAYWLIRPTQVDPEITVATPVPNHPSYPSSSSCETGAWQAVLVEAFPSEERMIDATAREASLSRLIGGLHFRFDCLAGLRLGRKAGRLALRRGLDHAIGG